MQSVWDRERGVWRAETKCSLSTHGPLHWDGKPIPNFWHQVAHQHRVVEARQEHLCRWKPTLYTKTPTFPHHTCLKLSHSFFPLRLDAAGGSKSFLCFFMRPPKNDQDLTRASSVLCGDEGWSVAAA